MCIIYFSFIFLFSFMKGFCKHNILIIGISLICGCVLLKMLCIIKDVECVFSISLILHFTLFTLYFIYIIRYFILYVV